MEPKKKKEHHPDDLRPNQDRVTPPADRDEDETKKLDYDPDEYDDFNPVYETNE